MEEGVLVEWLANEGDEVSAGDVIAQVETDKATMDLEVYDDGVLLKRVIAEGDAVPIGALIAVLGQKGEDPTPVLEKYAGGGTTGTAESEKETPSERSEAPVSTGDGAPAPEPAQEASPTPGGDGFEGRIKASPLARKLARDHGLDLARVQGTGPEGRIVKRDVETAIESGVSPQRSAPAVEFAAPGTAEPASETVAISQMRKAIARRVTQGKFTAPHFYLTMDVDMRKSVDFRTRLNELAESQGHPRISFNDLITKACALALRSHPFVNGTYLEKEGMIRQHNGAHIAIAVAIEDGLMTPVIRDADRKSLGQIAEETRALAEKARNRTIQPSEYGGSTFMTSNLGMFGIEEFTAIINPPNACALAIGAIRDVAEIVDGQVVPGKRMKVTLSCDHRIVDGAIGAEYMATLRTYLEEPLNLLM